MKRAILIGLGALALAGCYSPQDYAAGDAAVIAARTEADRQAVAINAEATRQAVIAQGQAELEIERARELQRMTLAQQAQAQEAEHLAHLSDIEAQSAQRLADIEAQKAEATARGSVAWVWPIGGAAVLFVLAAGATAIAVRMGSAWALKVERQADTPLLFHYDPKTLTAPVILTLVGGQPVGWNPNTGEVMPLSVPRNGEAARMRYLAAQNIVALQAGGDHAPMIPTLNETER